ncbi:MAG: hypothetical protein C0453_15090, partial [Comamonadaceae bacterium]|nr:hypothetical protein [Comamonadaceae bacterium]
MHGAKSGKGDGIQYGGLLGRGIRSHRSTTGICIQETFCHTVSQELEHVVLMRLAIEHPSAPQAAKPFAR